MPRLRKRPVQRRQITELQKAALRFGQFQHFRDEAEAREVWAIVRDELMQESRRTGGWVPLAHYRFDEPERKGSETNE